MCKGPGAEVPVVPGIPGTECGAVSRVARLGWTSGWGLRHRV